MELKAIKTNKTLGITEGKTYKCWTVIFGDYSIFKVDDNDNGDTIICPSSVFERVER